MTSPIRVAQVMAGALQGGAENFYARLVSALADYPAINQKAFLRQNKNRQDIIAAAGVDLETFRFGGPLHLLDHWRYRQSLKDWSPDIVLTYMNRATQITPGGNYRLVARLGHFYDLKYYRHCDYWIGNTRGICDYLIRGGMSPDKVIHIANFVDERTPDALDKTLLDTPENTPLILALGRLHTNKAFDVLIKSMLDVPEAILWLAGDGPERSALEQLAKDLGVMERIRFLGWRSDVNALMRTADVFVCPSRHEGLGNIILEAWFNRVPLVSTRSQGPSELIENEETGLLTTIDDDKEMAEAINRLLGDLKSAKQMALNAYAGYMANYSQKHISQQYVSFFKQVINQNG